MSNMNVERVLSVHHWNDTLFSFKTTRDPGLRFENGQFVMIGLQQENGRPLMRAYSIAVRITKNIWSSSVSKCRKARSHHACSICSQATS